MISKCLLVASLLVVAEVNAFKYSQDSISYVKPEQSMGNNFKYSYQSTPVTDKLQRIVTSSSIKSSNQNQNLGYVRPAINTSPITRTYVARGKYPVTLQNSGPAPDKKIPVITSHLRAPVQEKPTVRLQAKIPAPKTIAHTCTCFKTIVKPRVQQHLISVPTIQRYIETLHRPVVENIHYEAYPVRCLGSADGEEKDKDQAFQVQPVEVSGASGVQVQSDKNSGIQTFEFPTGFEMPKIQSEKNQVIEIPRIQFAEGQKSQTVEIPRVQFSGGQNSEAVEIPRIQYSEGQKSQIIEIPRVQFIQNKKPQAVEIELPRLQFVEPQKSEGLEIPQTQFLENKKPQFVEILNPAQFVENNKAGNVQLPGLEFLQAPKIQTVEIPRIQVEESPKVQTVEIPHQGGGITLGGASFAYQSRH